MLVTIQFCFDFFFLKEVKTHKSISLFSTVATPENSGRLLRTLCTPNQSVPSPGKISQKNDLLVVMNKVNRYFETSTLCCQYIGPFLFPPSKQMAGSVLIA